MITLVSFAPASESPQRNQGKLLPIGQPNRRALAPLVINAKNTESLSGPCDSGKVITPPSQSLYLGNKGVQLQGHQSSTLSIIQYHL